jgi:hypothetical protein
MKKNNHRKKCFSLLSAFPAGTESGDGSSLVSGRGIRAETWGVIIQVQQQDIVVGFHRLKTKTCLPVSSLLKMCGYENDIKTPIRYPKTIKPNSSSKKWGHSVDSVSSLGLSDCFLISSWIALPSSTALFQLLVLLLVREVAMILSTQAMIRSRSLIGYRGWFRYFLGFFLTISSKTVSTQKVMKTVRPMPSMWRMVVLGYFFGRLLLVPFQGLFQQATDGLRAVF